MTLFRTRTTVYELGSALFELAKNEVTDQMDKEALERLAPDDDEEAARLLFELLVLRLFAVDFAVYSYGGDQGTVKALLDVHYDHLRESAAGIGEPEEFFAELRPRLLEYGQAVSTEHRMGPAWQAGKTFAERAGHAGSAVCAMVGTGMFSATLAGVRDLLAGVKIQDA